MKELSAEQIQQNLNRFYELINKYITGDRKDKLIDFYKSLEEVLALAPASTKLDHHNCFPGGYVDHVVRVVEASLVFEKVWDKFGQKKKFV